MPYNRRNFYDPIVESPPPPEIVLPEGVEAPPVPPVTAEVAAEIAEQDGMVPARALLIERVGMYLHVEEVAAALRQMALERPEWAEPLELAAAGFLQPQVIE